jgi:acyl-CoA synthetase (AMP-forming)/AMP-acid ligase II/thioesterase domain-containing protein/acyl carrier protein
VLLENEGRVLWRKRAPSARSPEPDAQRTLNQVIGRTARCFPHEPAIVTTAFAPLTYHALQLQLDDVRRQLRSGGFDSSARIAVLMPNGPEAVLAIVAVACHSIAVPLDPRLSAAEIDQRLDLLHLNALVVPHGRAAEVRQAAARRSLVVIDAAPAGNGQLGVNLVVPVSDAPATDAEPDPAATAFILQTSGTTAQPKLVPFSHRNMLAAAARLQAWFGLTRADRCLSVSPPCYSHGLKVTVFTPLLTGGSIAIPANNALVAPDEWFDELRPTWYSAGPTLHTAVLDKVRARVDVQAAHTLRFVVSGGAPLPDEIRDGLQRVLGVPVLEHYGSSEAAQIAANRPPPGANRGGTCGQPWPDTLTIVSEDGHPQPVGARGEIWVRGPTVMSGYLDAGELNRVAFTAGWFRTGDIGSLDADGFLSLHGRLSELINRGGEKIAPAEIEAALLRHSAIAEAAAFAIPHPRLGEDVAAAIVPHPGAQATAVELRQFLRRELASFKIPHRILTLSQLPKGPTGKIQRRALRASLERLLDHQALMPAPDLSRGRRDLEVDLLALWRRLLKSDSVTVDDDFFASGGDSLLAVELLIQVEELIGRSVPETILFGAETVRQLAARIAAQRSAPATRFFQFNADGARPPLYFFNGDLVSGHACLWRLVELLGRDYPIISIDPHGLRGDPVPPSIEEMAADRLPLILQGQGSGPFLVGGKCNGAMVAFEAARLLIAAGHKVQMVAMVDPPTVGARAVPRAILRPMKPIVSPDRLGWTYELLVRLEAVFKASTRGPLGKRLKQLAGWIGTPHRPLSKPNHEIPSALWDAYSIAMARYLPAPLEVPVTFYAADHDGRGWRLGSQVDVIEVPGGHRDCLTVGAERLVGHLRQRIDALASGACP